MMLDDDDNDHGIECHDDNDHGHHFSRAYVLGTLKTTFYGLTMYSSLQTYVEMTTFALING